MEPDRERFDGGPFTALDGCWKPQRLLDVEFDKLSIRPLRGRMEAGQGVLRAHNPKTVFAFSEPEGTALFTRVIRQCGRHFADLPVRRPRFNDLACELVTKDGPVRNDEDPGMSRVQVGAADAAIMNLENDLAGASLGIFHVFDAQRLAQLMKNGGLHFCSSSGLAGPILCGPRRSFVLQFQPTIGWPAYVVHRPIARPIYLGGKPWIA